MGEKIYRYGDNYYDIEEIYELDSHMAGGKRKLFRDCISHGIISEIFKRNNLNNEAKVLDTIADLEKSRIDKGLSKTDNALYSTRYSLCATKLFLMSGRFQKYKLSEFGNGEWLLNRLVSLTIGSGYPTCSYNDLSMVDHSALTKDECKAISDNFKRNIRGEEMVFYKSAKTLRKER